MTVKELYTSIDGSYESALRILQMDRLIAKFIVRFPDENAFDKLMAARAARDGTGVFEAAHSMKGVCGNLGLNRLAELAGAITEQFRPGKAPTMTSEELEAQFQALQALYERSVAAIRRFAAEQG